jgi:integration host factor subunit beta
MERQSLQQPLRNRRRATSTAITATMIRSGLVKRLSDRHPHLPRHDVGRLVATFFDQIANALARADRVELRGFASFWIKRRDPRVARDPRFGASVRVGQKYFARFSPGKVLRNQLNQSPSHPI